MTLTFDLLAPKVGHFIPLPSLPLVPICSKIGSFVFKISCSRRTDRLKTIMPLCSVCRRMHNYTVSHKNAPLIFYDKFFGKCITAEASVPCSSKVKNNLGAVLFSVVCVYGSTFVISLLCIIIYKKLCISPSKFQLHHSGKTQSFIQGPRSELSPLRVCFCKIRYSSYTGRATLLVVESLA